MENNTRTIGAVDDSHCDLIIMAKNKTEVLVIAVATSI